MTGCCKKVVLSLTLVAFSFLATAAGARTTVWTFGIAFNPATIGPGSSSQLIFTIENRSGTTGTGVAFTDPLPTGVVIAPVTGATSECGGTLSAPAGGSSIDFSGGVVPGNSTCNLYVNVTSSVSGPHTNNCGILTSANLGTSLDPTAVLTVATDHPGISKSFSPPQIVVGQRSTLTLVIDNSANANPVSSFTVTDTFPAGMVVATPSNASNDCGASLTNLGNGFTFFAHTNDTIAAYGTCTLSIDVVANAPGELDNVTADLLSAPTVEVIGGFPHDGFATAALQSLAVTQIPTLNVWALIALAGLLSLSAAWFLKR